MDFFNLGEHILNLIEVVIAFWNDKINMVFSLLGQSPVDFKGGDPWSVVEQIEPIFVGVGSSLVVLFFVIGFCSESVDVKEDMRFEVILRMLLRVGIAEWLVANNVTIMKAFFTSAGALVGLLTNNKTKEMTISTEQAEVIKNLGFGASLIMMVLTVVILTYKHVGLTLSAYIAIPVVAPIALGGFYTFQEMSFFEVMKRRFHFMFGNKELTYVSTEREAEIKKLEGEKRDGII